MIFIYVLCFNLLNIPPILFYFICISIETNGFVAETDRCGHGQDFNHLSDERSPVFLQFLDSLHQVLLQFPTAFEYTDHLLLFLADHVSSCLFGNFLGDLNHYH